MGRKKQIGSRLVKWIVSANNPDTDKRDNWVVWFTGNNPDDRRDWLNMARKAGFSDIKLERVK